MYKLSVGVVFLGALLFNGCSDDDAEPSSAGGAPTQSGGKTGSGGTANGGELNRGGTSSAGAAGSGGVWDTGPDGGTAGDMNTGRGGGLPGFAGADGDAGSGGQRPDFPDCPEVVAGAGGTGAGGAGASGVSCDAAAVLPCSARIQNDRQLEALRGIGVVRGNLTLSGDVTSLDALSCLTRVNGNLIIKDAKFESLKGLDSLAQIDGGLYVYEERLGPRVLASLSGLEGLTRIGGELVVGELHFYPSSETCCFRYFSPPIASLTPLRNLKSVRRILLSETALVDLDGLQNVTELESLVLISMNSLETLHGLEGLSRIYGSGSAQTGSTASSAGLLISSNADLQTLGALSNLTRLTSALIQGNPALTNIRGLSNVQGVQSFNVSYNSALDTCQVNDVAAQIETAGGIPTKTIANNAACAP